jgi:peptidoglycan/LPS O-acetylase OafA/YrhL
VVVAHSASLPTTTTSSEAPRVLELKHIRELDGARGLAILLVLELHFISGSLGPLRRFAGAGWVGVDLFFVLSGFLITRILRGSLTSPAFFRNFYARRALRIWPLYYLIIAFAFAGTRLLPHGLRIGPKLLPFYLTFTQNLVGSVGFGPWAVAVTWSLAIEEQFYFFFPLCVRFLSLRRLVLVLLALLLITPALRIVALTYGVLPTTVYMTTWFRLDTLAAGALAAVLVDSPLRNLAERFSASVCILALSVAAISCCTFFGGDVLILKPSAIYGLPAVVYALTFSMIAVGFAAFIVLVVSNRAPTLRGVLRNRGLCFLGKISFGVYLIHGIAIPLAQSFLRAWLQALGLTGRPLGACVVAVALMSTLLLAAVSWRFVEAPILRFRKLFPAR